MSGTEGHAGPRGPEDPTTSDALRRVAEAVGQEEDALEVVQAGTK